ncbi:MAG: Fe2+-dependent dioxygenase [Flavobacteriaceae bacterium]
MLMRIADLLSADETAAAMKVLGKARFVDGRATAGWHAKLVKNNMQATNDAALAKLRDTLSQKILSNMLFTLWARPKALTPLLLSRYEPGMNYGSHVDDALMGGMRTDVSFTLFLSDPDSYEGGGLVIETTAGEEVVKLPAGHMVAYPSTTLHRVEAVTSGVRYAAVGWARSFVREPEKREILFDLETARRSLFEREGKSGEFDLVSKAGTNLLRMWAED